MPAQVHKDQLPTVVVPEEDHIKSPCTAAEGSERYLGVFLPGLEQDAVVRKVQQVKQFQGKLNQRYRQLLSLQNIPHPPVSSAPAERTASSQHITSGAGWTEALHTHTVLATSCPSTTSDNPPVKQMWPLALEIIGLAPTGLNITSQDTAGEPLLQLTARKAAATTTTTTPTPTTPTPPTQQLPQLQRTSFPGPTLCGLLPTPSSITRSSCPLPTTMGGKETQEHQQQLLLSPSQSLAGDTWLVDVPKHDSRDGALDSSNTIEPYSKQPGAGERRLVHSLDSTALHQGLSKLPGFGISPRPHPRLSLPVLQEQPVLAPGVLESFRQLAAAQVAAANQCNKPCGRPDKLPGSGSGTQHAATAAAAAPAFTSLDDLDVVLQDCDTPSLMTTPRQCSKAAPVSTSVAAPALADEGALLLSCLKAKCEKLEAENGMLNRLLARQVDRQPALPGALEGLEEEVGRLLGANAALMVELEASKAREARLQERCGQLESVHIEASAKAKELEMQLRARLAEATAMLQGNLALLAQLQRQQQVVTGAAPTAASTYVPPCVPAAAAAAAAVGAQASAAVSAVSVTSLASAFSGARGNLPRYAQPTKASAARNRDIREQRMAAAAARAAEAAQMLGANRLTNRRASFAGSFVSMRSNRTSIGSGVSRAAGSVVCKTRNARHGLQQHQAAGFKPAAATTPAAAAHPSRLRAATPAAPCPAPAGTAAAADHLRGDRLSTTESVFDGVGECIFQAAQQAHAVGESGGADDGDEWGSDHMVLIAGQGSDGGSGRNSLESIGSNSINSITSYVRYG